MISMTLVVLSTSARAGATVDRLINAIGIPMLIQSFVQDGTQSATALDETFLSGQGADVFYETVRKLYAADRLETELRQALAKSIDATTAEKALLFFESELGQKIVELEVQARQAMVDPVLEAAAKAAAGSARNQVLRLLRERDLIGRNVEIALAARQAFYDGVLLTSDGNTDTLPSIESQRSFIEIETSAWVTGYYVLVASALSDTELDKYASFWETDVGVALNRAVLDAFEASYVTLSFGLGQAVGRLLPQNEL